MRFIYLLLQLPLNSRQCASFSTILASNNRLSRSLFNSIIGQDIDYSINPKPSAHLIGYIEPTQLPKLERILKSTGFDNVYHEQNIHHHDVSKNEVIYRYRHVIASGMLKLIQDNDMNAIDLGEAPRYIPVQAGEEIVLVENGWSFLDPDESEPMSAFDIDAANEEGQYKPKWGQADLSHDNEKRFHLSSLGFDIKRMSSDEVMNQSKDISNRSREVLLQGGTDNFNEKLTNNDIDLTGSIYDFDVGIFTCAIGNNPLFTTNDLSPLTASSGWLTFMRPISDDHIELVYPDKNVVDQRIEVIDAKSGCHLGHYFGEDGYCINASSLNFYASQDTFAKINHPTSWNALHLCNDTLNKSQQIVKDILMKNVRYQEVILGAGCFWHVEYALRRLPGILDTTVGYSGGNISSPTYEKVCKERTGHAEVVRVIFDPTILDFDKLLDCFLAMHDPTIVRAHGKRSKDGQYRSCIFFPDEEQKKVATNAIIRCQKQLGKVLSTQVATFPRNAPFFWTAEDRHQLHDQSVKKKTEDDLKTLSEVEWLLGYGRRSSSIWGSSEISIVDDSEDDGMARMMI